MPNLLNYQWMMIYMFNISIFNGFQMWSKLPKYIWNIHQASTYIYEFSIAVPKISKRPNFTNKNTLISLRRFTWSEETTKLPMNMGINNELYFFYHFHKCTKLPKYLRYINQASVYIYELSIAVLKISKLPSPTTLCMLIYLKRVTS